MRIVFRVDASILIGKGHLMRCLALADVLSSNGAKCKFVSREDSSSEMLNILEGRHELVLLKNEPYFPNQLNFSFNKSPHAFWLPVHWLIDARQTISHIEHEEIDWLVVDHYALDIEWERKLRPYVKKIIVVDDLADRDHDCDLLIDQNIDNRTQERYEARVPANCRLLVGSQYAMIQEIYVDIRKKSAPKRGPISKVLIFFGGGDTHNLTEIAVNSFLALNQNHIAADVVINPNSSSSAEIRKIAQLHSNITVHEALPSLAHLISAADLAIGAAGTVSWERCCLGLPAILVTIADNQKMNAAMLEKRSLAKWIGHYDEINEIKLKNALINFIKHQSIEKWSKKCMSAIDGRGVYRILSILMVSQGKNLQVREATLSDEILLFRWVNDPLVRRNAFASRKIALNEHRKWFKEFLQNSHTGRIFIIETDANVPIAQVRFEEKKHLWTIDYSLDHIVRGIGLGSTILKAAISKLTELEPNPLLIAYVKKGNRASENTFKKLGFAETFEGNANIYSAAAETILKNQ